MTFTYEQRAVLRDILAPLYPNVDEQQRFLRDAGFDGLWFRIRYDFNPAHCWYNILEFAAKQVMLEEIITQARKEFPRNTLLQRITEANPPALIQGPDITDRVDWHGDGQVLERITGKVSALVPISFLELGLQRARAVAKVVLADGACGSGFLTADNLFITNNHVLASREVAASAVAQFNFQKRLDGLDMPLQTARFLPDQFFATSIEDDWTAVRLEGDPAENQQRWGGLELKQSSVQAEDLVNIIQHPGGDYKQLSFSWNAVAWVGEGRVQYLTDTLPGSSGSPVFDRNWEVIALHHSGGWLLEPGDTSKHKFYRNEGIQIDVVMAGIAAAGG